MFNGIVCKDSSNLVVESSPKVSRKEYRSWIRMCEVLVKALSVEKANYVLQHKLLELCKYFGNVTMDNMDMFS